MWLRREASIWQMLVVVGFGGLNREVQSCSDCEEISHMTLPKSLGFSYVLCHIHQAEEFSSLGHFKWYLFIFLIIESHPLCHSGDLWNLRASSECCHYAGPKSVMNFTRKISQNNQPEGRESHLYVFLLVKMWLDDNLYKLLHFHLYCSKSFNHPKVCRVYSIYFILLFSRCRIVLNQIPRRNPANSFYHWSCCN